MSAATDTDLGDVCSWSDGERGAHGQTEVSLLTMLKTGLQGGCREMRRPLFITQQDPLQSYAYNAHITLLFGSHDNKVKSHD